MTWLNSLPHQIPFRAASAVRNRTDKTIEGTFLWTGNETLPPELMLVEAMAQFAGGLAFHETRGPGFFTGIDRCELTRAIEPGDVVEIAVTLEVNFGGTYRFRGTGTIAGLECIRGTFYLAAAPLEDRPDAKT